MEASDTMLYGLRHFYSLSKSVLATVRIRDSKGRIGIASITSLESEAISSAVAIALDIARYQQVKKECLKIFRPRKGSRWPRSAETAPIGGEIKDIIHAVEQKRFNIYKLFEKCELDLYANSGGIELRQQINTAKIHAEEHVEGAKLPLVATDVDSRLSSCKLDALANELENRKKQYTNRYKAFDTRATVLVSGNAFLDLMHIMRFLYQSNTVASGRYKEIRSGSLTSCKCRVKIFDNLRCIKNPSAVLFDEEGCLTKKTKIFDSGMFCRTIANQHYARLFGHAPTGHGRLGKPDDSRAHFLEVEAETDTLIESPLLQIGDYVFIESFNFVNMGINRKDASFVLPFTGTIYKKGQCRGYVDSALVKASITEVLKGIVNFSHTTQRRYSHGCSPSMCIEGLHIQNI